MEKLIETIVEAIQEKKGKNIVSLDLSGFDGAICSHFVVCNADSTTQVAGIAAGIEEILIITSSGKEAIQHHFNPAFELEARLTATGKEALRDELRAINNLAEIHYLHQQELNGLGDAVRLARSFAAGEGFAVLLGDTVLHSDSRPVTGQLIEAALELDAPVTALETVPWERVSRYGVIAGKSEDGRLYRVDSFVEKPSREEAPSNLVVASRYVFTSEIFDMLDRTPRGKGNEIQLTDAMRMLLEKRPMYGLRIDGRRYDIGNKLGFLTATVEFGLRRPEFSAAFAAYLKEVVKNL